VALNSRAGLPGSALLLMIAFALVNYVARPHVAGDFASGPNDYAEDRSTEKNHPKNECPQDAPFVGCNQQDHREAKDKDS